jgi:hypothetical protein
MKDICKICNNLEIDKTIINDGKHEIYKYCVAKNIPLNNLIVTRESCNSFTVADTATPEEKYKALLI